MHIEFFGAAGEVTGSCHILRIGGRTILLDCGLIQGGRKDEARNADPFPFDAATVDASAGKGMQAPPPLAAVGCSAPLRASHSHSRPMTSPAATR